MDSITGRILSALKARESALLTALGDYPKSDPFEHGLQVGAYRGISDALAVMEQVLNDLAENELRR